MGRRAEDDTHVTWPMLQARAQRRRRRVLIALAAVVIVGTGVLTTVLLTRQHTFVVSGNVGFADPADWDPAGGRCRPNGAATALVGSTLEAVAPDGRVMFRHVLADFHVGGDACVSYFRHAEIPDVADRYTMRLAGRDVGVLTRADLVRATSPDAYPGVGFALTDCASGCRLTVPSPYTS